MHLVDYQLFPFDVKLLYPLRIKLNPIQNLSYSWSVIVIVTTLSTINLQNI